jgi:hypothetical protein
MPDTRLDDLRERHRYVEGHNADGDERSGCICGELWQCDAADALAHIDALTAETRAVCAAWLAQDDKGLDGAMADLCATMGMEP